MGHPFNSEFCVEGKKQCKYVGPITSKTYQSIAEELVVEGPAVAGNSNKDLYDTNTAQQLTATKISAMQTEGVVGKDLVEELVEHSRTFDKKTVYSQEKYIKKKEKKHVKKLFVYSPTVQKLCKYYWTHTPGKINYIRFDTLGLILHTGDVHPGAFVTINENASGLVLAAVAERMGGEGIIHYVYTDNNMELEILSKLNSTSFQKKNIMYTNMNSVLEHESLDKKPAAGLLAIALKEQEGSSTRYLPHIEMHMIVS